MTDRETIQERIRKLGEFLDTQRRNRRWTFPGLSRTSGISIQTLQNVRKGNNLSLKTVMCITDTIGYGIKLVDKTSGEEYEL